MVSNPPVNVSWFCSELIAADVSAFIRSNNKVVFNSCDGGKDEALLRVHRNIYVFVLFIYLPPVVHFMLPICFSVRARRLFCLSPTPARTINCTNNS